MTPADRRALAAALRHGRARYAFRPGWDSLGRRNYRWYPRPYDGCWPPELEVSVLGEDYRLLAFGINRMATDSVRHALSVLAFFGVYQPAMAEAGT